MRIPRIFHPQPIVIDTEFELTAEATHHIANVLRLKPGHPIVLFNGDGNEYSAELISVAKRQVIVEADACLSLSKESPLYLHLGQGISKGDRMEMVLQKAVELGVTEITPLITERCTVKLDEKRWEKKQQQWHKIIYGACEQSGRNTLPKLNAPTGLSQWLAKSTKAQRVTLSPTARDPITKLAYHSHGYQLLIGPEGGLSENEVHQAQESGYLTVSMGPRVLRTETAALTSLSILQALHGDF
ncbi:16S rRNA (uracil(1498)-N(3))-methyltransferase [Alteromonas sp. ASW11-130]|uniref:16S rRNA (uracil(1498)-N(3))-methyltransferase n=1 Tax=Alteromonas sp. ASW11-130 TaxID=3015775 RepID=UPI002241C3B4|nr:16S rRNA (uracil(1498)-N(3))-methyltransferase [Alteromonas sp. ASW11-130]MCW8091752.1 16S rRNA (uracil(1498)-N(3))-methyltransferase [Alteromonas sp. ASW11-130]